MWSCAGRHSHRVWLDGSSKPLSPAGGRSPRHCRTDRPNEGAARGHRRNRRGPVPEPGAQWRVLVRLVEAVGNGCLRKCCGLALCRRMSGLDSLNELPRVCGEGECEGRTADAEQSMGGVSRCSAADQAKRRGAEGSRTLTGTDLNRVPLPIGLRPRCRFAAVLRLPSVSQLELNRQGRCRAVPGPRDRWL